MAYFGLKIFWNVWIGVAVVLFLIQLSRFMFGKNLDARAFVKSLVLIPAWPVCLFSEGGRGELKKIIGEGNKK